MRVRITVFAIASLFLVAMVGYAQQTLGTISGTITDSSGAVLPGAKVELLNEETGISRSVVTNNVGFYNAPALGLGNYKITATQDGFQTEVRSGIELTVGRNAVVNFQLKVGSVATTVEVTGEAPLVETTKGGLGSLVESKTVSDLPLNGRDLAQLITLQTGAVEYTGGGTADLGSGKLVVVSGARPTTNVFVMDGVAIESFTEKVPTGTSGQFLGAEAVREFRVESNAYSAEFGRGAGGIFNLATKSGTNTFHGSLFEYVRNDNFDANRWETNKVLAPKPEFKRNQFGASMGGPIKKDRTFFFGTWEALHERLGIVNTTTTFSDYLRAGFIPSSDKNTLGVVPAAPVSINPATQPYLNSALWPRPNSFCTNNCNLTTADPFDHPDGTADFTFAYAQPTDENLYQFRVDHKLTDKDNVFARYSFLKSEQTRVNGWPYDFTQDLVKSQSLTIEHDRILSAIMLNTFRFGFSRNVPNEAELQNPPIPSDLYFVPSVPQMGGISITNGPASVGQGVPGEQRAVNSFQWVDDMSITKGRNAMKFGVNINRIQFNGYNPGRDAAQFAFLSPLDFFNANANGRFRGSIFANNNDAHRSFRDYIIGLYYQDDIHLTPRLTVNAGLRYEFITTPSENWGRVGTFHGDLAFIRSVGVEGITVGNPWIQNPSHKNFAPRIGFGWDVFGNGKMAVRGGWGLFFQQVDQSWYRTSGFRTPPILSEGDIAAKKNPGDPASVPFPDVARICGQQNPFAITNPQCAGTLIVPDLLSNSLRSPYVMQYNLNIQREVIKNTVVTVGYAGSRGIDLAGVADVNNWDPQELNGRLVYSPDLVAATSKTNGCTVTSTTLAVRPNCHFDQIRLRHTGYDSWYNSLQLNVSHKYAQGLLLNGSYTFSKTLDTISGIQTASDTAAGSNTIPIYGHSDLYKGRSAFDATHVFSFNSTYELPVGKGKAFMGSSGGAVNSIVSGWQMGGIITLASGFPETISMGSRVSSLGVVDEYTELNPGFSNNPTTGTSAGCSLNGLTVAPGTKLGTPDTYFDPCAFNVPTPIAPAGVSQSQCSNNPSPCYLVLGNLGRNTVSMPGRATVDFSLLRSFDINRLHEGTKLQFRFEVFNLFNRVNLGIPTRQEFSSSGKASTSTAQISSTNGTPRQLQFALRLTF